MNIGKRMGIALLSGLTASFALAEVVFVHSAKAPLLSDPIFSATVLTVLERGTELTVLSTDKRWVEARFGDQQGWVSVLLIRDNPPLDTVEVLGSDQVTLEGDARVRASSVATAGATRGLTSGEDGSGMVSDYDELEDMEAMSIPFDAILRFALEMKEAE